MEMACKHVRIKSIHSPDNSPEHRRLALLGMRARLVLKMEEKLNYAREAAGDRNYRNAAKQITYTVRPLVELLTSYAAVR
jgi:hypothetical protein